MSAVRWLATLGCALLMVVFGGLVNQEVRARLDRLPFALLRLARARLPGELRERVHDQEWFPELDYILQRTQLLPITRLIAATWYALGLVLRAGTVGAELLPPESAPPGDRGALARLRGAAGRSADALQPLIWPAQEPMRVRLYVVAVVGAAAGTAGTMAAFTTMHAHDVELFMILVASALAGEQIRTLQMGSLAKNMRGVWILPAAVLLPAIYALVVPLSILVLSEWRCSRHDLAYKRVFSAAAQGLGFGVVSALAHAVAVPRAGHVVPAGASPLNWMLVVAACCVLAEAITFVLVVTAIKGSAPETRIFAMLTDQKHSRYELTAMCVSVAGTFAVAFHLLLAIAMVPAVILLNRHLTSGTPTSQP